MSELAKVLANQNRDIDYIKTQIGAPSPAAGSGASHYLIRQETIAISIGSANIQSRDLGSSFILGHSGGLGWLGSTTGSIATGSQPYLGDSRGSWGNLASGVNMVFTDIGETVVRNFLGGQSPTAPTYMAIGSDSTTAMASDTTLGSEFESSRYSFDSITSGTGYVEFESVIPSTSPTEQPTYIREIGLFDSSSSGSMFSRSNFTGFWKANNIELQTVVRVDVSGC